MAKRLASSRSLALAGPAGASGPEAEQLALAVTLLNLASGSLGNRIDFSRPHALSNTATEEQFENFLQGLTPDDIVLLHKTNPVYTRPGSEELLKKAGMVVYLGTMLDETAALADWFLPVHDDLESWGEYEPWAGIRSLMQPTMTSLADSVDAGDVLIRLAAAQQKILKKSAGSALQTTAEWLRDRWRLKVQAVWDESLRNGGYWSGFITGKPGAVPAPTAGAINPGKIAPRPALKENEAHLWLWPSVMLFDGRTANRGWIQEAPEPMSTVTWGSWIEIHPNKVKALGIRESDVLELVSENNRIVQAPVRVTAEVAEDVVAMAFGQGHTALGAVAANVGANACKLLPQSGNFEGYFGRVTIRRTGKRETIAYGMTTREQHERDLLQWKTLDEARTRKPGPLILPLPEGYTLERDLYKSHKHKGHRWAMAIDLQRCIGCGACAVACYAENNVAITGKKGVADGRLMAWLRVVPYRHNDSPLRIGWLPMLCQHCDAAPCEPVCPVYASVHNEEGLNAQIFNRCIGTRYCSNNCPYKVRRFNWFDRQWKKPLDRQLNPEVTVRVRGVMEKCTFCIQRIRNAQHRAKQENRKVKDGEVQPACVQSCPAKVFTFGDLLDPDSEISKVTRNHPRRYHVLEELNTKPAVTYLFRILQEEKT